MPNKQQHIDRVNYNLNQLAAISTFSDDSYDWQAILAFYVSVHLVEADLAEHQLVVVDHKERNLAISNIGGNKNVKLSEDLFSDYMRLLKSSHKARYLAHIEPHVDASKSYMPAKTVLQLLKCLDRLLVFYEKKLRVSFMRVAVKTNLPTDKDRSSFSILRLKTS